MHDRGVGPRGRAPAGMSVVSDDSDWAPPPDFYFGDRRMPAPAPPMTTSMYRGAIEGLLRRYETMGLLELVEIPPMHLHPDGSLSTMIPNEEICRTLDNRSHVERGDAYAKHVPVILAELERVKKERDGYLANLSSVQARCTDLLEATRSLRRGVTDSVIAEIGVLCRRKAGEDIVDAVKQMIEIGDHEPLGDGQARLAAGASAWRAFPRIRRVDDGVSDRLDRDRLKALGNSAVPAVARVIGRIIQESVARVA